MCGSDDQEKGPQERSGATWIECHGAEHTGTHSDKHMHSVSSYGFPVLFRSQLREKGLQMLHILLFSQFSGRSRVLDGCLREGKRQKTRTRSANLSGFSVHSKVPDDGEKGSCVRHEPLLLASASKSSSERHQKNYEKE